MPDSKSDKSDSEAEKKRISDMTLFKIIKVLFHILINIFRKKRVLIIICIVIFMYLKRDACSRLYESMIDYLLFGKVKNIKL